MVAVGLFARPKRATLVGVNGWFGPWELLIVLGIVLLIFGPKRLPSLGRSLGQGARSFKDAITGRHKDAEDEDEVEVEVPALPPSPDVEPAREPKRETEKV
jgi:sec-independent protein translocase protein TatA